MNKLSPIDALFVELYDSNPTKAGQAYEKLVAAALKLVTGIDYNYDQHITGIYSNTDFQLDAHSPQTSTMVEAKDYSIVRRNQISQQLFGIIEVDETYVNPGHRIEKKRGRGTSKVAVFGLVERKGNISITPVENTKRKTLDPIIRRKVIPGSRIMSDEWSAYNKLRDGYIHEVVKQQIIVYYFCFFRTWVLCR